MSSLIIEVCTIDEVKPHPNADRLAIAVVKGWETCIGYNPETKQAQFKKGDKCTFIPPDSVLPIALAERLNVAQYCVVAKKDDQGFPTHYRVRAARLRSVPSYGFVIAVENNQWNVGENVANFYDITKWEPPEPPNDGEQAHSTPGFHKYVEIENWQNFPNLFQEGEEIVITEKIHGKNCRVAYVVIERNYNGEGSVRSEFFCGSHNYARKQFDTQGRISDFWKPLEYCEGLKELLLFLSGDGNQSVIVFGEIFGADHQDTSYGVKKGDQGFRVFDISIDGMYLGFDRKKEVCEKFNVPMVSILYRGPYSVEIVRRSTDGPTTMCAQEQAGKFKGREGIVITPVKERIAQNFGETGFGRVILKSKSVDFIGRKGERDGH
ncbi:MAG: hypothetical protein HYW78_03055 [Parcubacteria group bacterium]|nr:hypothetical protein [Parcubacteria group bacterium]